MNDNTGDDIKLCVGDVDKNAGCIAESAAKSPWKAPTLTSLSGHKAEGGKSFFATEPTTDSGPS